MDLEKLLIDVITAAARARFAEIRNYLEVLARTPPYVFEIDGKMARQYIACLKFLDRMPVWSPMRVVMVA